MVRDVQLINVLDFILDENNVNKNKVMLKIHTFDIAQD